MGRDEELKEKEHLDTPQMPDVTNEGNYGEKGLMETVLSAQFSINLKLL